MGKALFASCLVLFACIRSFAQETKREIKEYGAPGSFAIEMQGFADMDNKQFPPPGGIVCIGSSSMRGWHPTIVEDLAPLTIIARGFGGSNMNEALFFADQIVIPYEPRAVVIYEGDNDVFAGTSPEKIRDAFRAFVEKVHEQLPETRIYCLSIKPSISRWNVWPQMETANRLIEKECSLDKRLMYVDIAKAMLGANGEPRKELFLNDNLHMTRAGYELWRDILKPILIEKELHFEPQKDNRATGVSIPVKDTAAPLPPQGP